MLAAVTSTGATKKAYFLAFLCLRRAQLAEAAFLDIAEVLGTAPDPTPLLSAAGALKASVDGM